MVQEIFLSFKDSVRDRIKNPFLGTLTIVWLVDNWRLVYGVFSFDDSFGFTERINYISNYFESNPLIEGLFYNCGYTFGILIITYILLNISRLIVNYSERQVKPWIFKITDRSSVVLMEDYKKLEKERDLMQESLSIARSKLASMEKEMGELENKLTVFSPDSDDGPGDEFIDELRKEVDTLNTYITESDRDNFIGIVRDIKKGFSISGNREGLDFAIDNNLLSLKERNNFGNYYELTYKGEMLYTIIKNDKA